MRKRAKYLGTLQNQSLLSEVKFSQLTNSYLVLASGSPLWDLIPQQIAHGL